MDSVRIIIPVYKELSCFEIISLTQCFVVLSNYPVSIVCPPHLNTQQLIDVAKDCKKEISVEIFNADFFKGIAGYNKLMMSVKFYSRFKKSKYLLIYQTDAFVFRDELKYWCDLNYDYIGAPWPFDVSDWIDMYPKEIKNYYKIFGRNNLTKTGNGGLSLRKTRSFINNLQLFKYSIKRWVLNEDMFFSHYVNTLNPFFRIPHHDVSKRFAFDADPNGFFHLNNNKLPFGGHGWYRNDDDYEGNLLFYKGFVESYGHNI